LIAIDQQKLRIRNRLLASGTYRIGVLLAVSMLMVCMESTVALRPGWRLDFSTMLCVFFALQQPLIPGLAFAVATGYFGDVLSGEPRGLYVTSTVTVFFLLRMLIARVVHMSWLAVTLIGVLATFIAIIVRILVVMVGDDFTDSFVGSLRQGFGARGVGAFLLTYPIYRLFRALDARLRRSEQSASGAAWRRSWNRRRS
jgi:cell shape-determining protein MreD